MLIRAQRNKIPPSSVFFMLFISRLVVSMTTTQSVTTGVIRTDMVISVLGAMLIASLLCIPVVVCVKKGKNPFDVGWLRVLYGIYFIFLAGLNISRFSYFASTMLNPNANAWVFMLLVSFCAFYGAYVGIEALSRFSSFAFVLLAIAIVTVLASNVKNYNELNLYPIISSSTKNIVTNIFIMTASTSELALFLCLSEKVNGIAVKQLGCSIVCVFTVIALLFLFSVAVMGEYAAQQSFPLYFLFQQAKPGGFERIDVLHISFWILGVFVKAALLVYCSSVSFGKISQKNSAIISAVGSFAAAMIVSKIFQSGNVSILPVVISFAAFCFVIPAAVLIFKKRSSSNESIGNM